MATKDITPKQYAKLMGVSYIRVMKSLGRKKLLPRVKQIKRFSRFYLLEVDETFLYKHLNK